jgi:hypothetical protein
MRKKPMAVPITLTISTGLRPTRSEIYPQMGEKINCAKE